MKYRPLSGTDLDLSVVGMGCWAIGGQYWGPVDDRESEAAVRRALELGINWFDTAPLYGGGHADEVLVAALGARKHEVTIATKVGARVDPAIGHAISDLTPEHVVADTEASLKRLGVDAIDLLQVHWPCNLDTPLEATLEALTGLQRAGKVRYIGLCNYDAATLRRAAELAPIVSLQTPYSMVRREFEHALRDVCAPPLSAGDPETAERDARFGVLAYETLCRGLLTGKFGATPPTFPETDMRSMDDRFQGRPFAVIHQLNRALEVIARKVGVPQAALPPAWVLARPGVTAAIVGAKTTDQVEQNVRAAELVDRHQVWSALAPYIDAVRP